MEPRFFEDWRVGEHIETLGRTVGDAEIFQLGGDPQGFAAAAQSTLTLSLFRKSLP